MMSVWWHVCFRIANFGVFIGFIVYLYQRYVKDFVDCGLRQEKQLLDGLHKEFDAAVHILDGYKTTVEQKRQEQELMRVMIQRWQQQVVCDNEQRRAERDALAAVLRDKAERKRNLMQAAQIANTVLPVAVDRATQELKVFFADQEEGRAFVKRTIIRMQE